MGSRNLTDNNCFQNLDAETPISRFLNLVRYIGQISTNLLALIRPRRNHGESKRRVGCAPQPFSDRCRALVQDMSECVSPPNWDEEDIMPRPDSGISCSTPRPGLP